MEAISLKRLGIYLKPIVLVNTRGFYDPLLHLLDRCIEERFMDERHAAMWQVAEGPERRSAGDPFRARLDPRSAPVRELARFESSALVSPSGFVPVPSRSGVLCALRFTR